MGLTPADFFVKVHFAPAPAVVLVLGGAWYGWALRRLRRQGRRWPAIRTVSFASAWLLMAVTAFSGLTDFARTNFSAFGSEYITAGLVAPALLALSAPLTLAVQSARGPRDLRWLDSRAMLVAANPFTTWVAFTATVFVLFFTRPLLAGALAGGATGQAVSLWLLAIGWLFFWPVVDLDPAPMRMGHWPRILYLLLTFPVFTIMGMGLESQASPVTSALSIGSLHLGGAVIWVAGESISLLGSLAVFTQWLRADERRMKSQETLNEAAAARQMALWRASREAAARAAPR